MKYSQILNHDNSAALIKNSFEHLCSDDVKKFQKNFKDHNGTQVVHTLRELVLGAYLKANGFFVRYEYVIEGETPDWSILSAQDESVLCILELSSFHVDVETEKEINNKLSPGKMVVVWRDERKDNVDRLWHKLSEKAQKYKRLSTKLKLPYVLAVFPEFIASVDFEEIRRCLLDTGDGIFLLYRYVSGLLLIQENSKSHLSQYSFYYLENPKALCEFILPNGVFPQD